RYEAEVPLKVTAVAEVKPEPVMVTESPGGPKLGEKPLTLGAATYVNEPVDVLPPGLVMPTDTVPAACAGVVTVSEVAERAVTVAALPPKVMLLALSRPVPVMVTAVPPATLPVAGVTVPIVGAGGGT